MKRLYIFLILMIAAVVLRAQIPTGYYNGTDNLTGNSLKSALHTIITTDDSHTFVHWFVDCVCYN